MTGCTRTQRPVGRFVAIRFNSHSIYETLRHTIEGAEFDLLDHLIATHWMQRIDHLQVQFHRFAKDAESRREKIRQALGQTHRLAYDYPFVWENWTRHDVPLPQTLPVFPALHGQG